jgi:2-polyprenyl-3-methyl-5-hydroxy-6-metoxy-1,4-benzoquinol methylase
MVGAGGRVVANDVDEIKLRLARQEAQQQQLTNLESRLADIVEDEFEKFDFAHARFVLTHLADLQKASLRRLNSTGSFMNCMSSRGIRTQLLAGRLWCRGLGPPPSVMKFEKMFR